MRALHFNGDQLALVDKPIPLPGPNQVRMRLLVAGICNTDLEIMKGYMGFVGTLGHEFVGIVETGPNKGRRATAEINFGCQGCSWCRRGLREHCPTRSVLGILNQDGAFSEQVLVPAANLHFVPDGLSNEQAVFCEPLAAALRIREQVKVQPSDSVVVLGDGKLGLLVAQAMALGGAKVLCVGKHEENLALLKRRRIATVLLDHWDREPADTVVEATGTAQGFSLALAATRPCGTLVLKSTVAAKEGLSLAPLVINEIRVVGSRCGPFAPALRLLLDRTVDTEGLVSSVYDLDEGLAAIQRAQQRGSLKVLLRSS